ncbi:MAG: DegV family protein [Clostridia bacterium]|nr:DegV family protein [Clostridia bacterium]
MFSVVTDTSANLDCELAKERNIHIVPFHYYVNGEDMTCTDTRSFDGKTFYDAMRAGAKVTTSQITPQSYIDTLTPLLEKGEDILFVGMSSGISGSYASAETAAAQLRMDFPERQIHLVDTLGASLGEGLLAVKAAECRDAGASVADTAALLDEMRVGMCQVFTVDDLKYLRRTGRLSNIVALVGTVLNIKPLLKGNQEGKIVSFATVRGRRRSIQAMAERYNSMVKDAANQTIGIAHADCADDVKYLIGLLNEKNPPKEIMTVMYEPVTGSHVGPGALALFFMGDEKFRGEGLSLPMNPT